MSMGITTFFSIIAVTLLISIQETVSMEVNGTFTLTITNRKNQTGHFISQTSVSNESDNIPSNWKLKIQQTMLEQAGIKSFQIGALFVVSPPVPADYQLFPGVGYYKFHTTPAHGFEDASLKCAMEGGHLAIVNSEAEHQVLKTLFARYPEHELKYIWAFVGFHDRLKEGEHVTIFGQPLKTTGFTRWSHPGQPDDYNGEDCGSVHRNGGLNDSGCEKELPFFCEYDLTWAEN